MPLIDLCIFKVTLLFFLSLSLGPRNAEDGCLLNCQTIMKYTFTHIYFCRADGRTQFKMSVLLLILTFPKFSLLENWIQLYNSLNQKDYI